MRRKIDYLFTMIIVILGIVHISLTPMFYPSINDEANIFIGMGLAFVFLGILNMARLLSQQKKVIMLCCMSNILAIAYLIFFSVTLKKMEPQFLIALIAVLIPAIYAVADSFSVKQ